MPAIPTINIKCPCCDTILVVNRATGEVIEVRKPLVEETSGDRFKDALRAEKEHSKKIENLFEETLSEIERKKAERQKLFEENLKKTREEGIDDYNPIRDIDLD